MAPLYNKKYLKKYKKSAMAASAVVSKEYQW
jgi:hypothetical protein